MRARDASHGIDVEPFVLFFAKSVALAGVVLYFIYNQRR